MTILDTINKKISEELLDYLYDESFYYCLSKREKYKTNENPQYSALIAAEQNLNLNTPTADLFQFHFTIILNCLLKRLS